MKVYQVIVKMHSYIIELGRISGKYPVIWPYIRLFGRISGNLLDTVYLALESRKYLAKLYYVCMQF